ncbi:hypothetical protein MKW94_012077, partial [Papaver nudicaule]|nr:hypothetical protein [Papaver nudicaule]
MSSFDGLAKGHAIPSRIKQDLTQAFASGVTKIIESVSTFQLLVNTHGTLTDTPHHRAKLRSTRLFIARLVKDTSAKLKQACDTTYQEAGAIKIALLAKEFVSALQEFQKAERVAAEREEQYAPFAAKQDVLLLDNATVLNEVEETEQCIQEIQNQIVHVHEIMKDL